MKLISSLIFGAVIASSSIVQAHDKYTQKSLDHFYIRTDIGISIPQKLKESVKNSYDGDSTKFNKPALFALAFGYNINESFRADVSIRKVSTYKYTATKDLNGNVLKNESISQKFNNLNYMINGYWHFWQSGFFHPFVTAGIGYAVNKSKPYIATGTYSTSGNKFLAQYDGMKSTGLVFDIGFGTNLKITERVLFDLAYKYVWMHKFKTSGTISGKAGVIPANITDPKSAKFNLHQIGVGLIFKL